MSQRGVLLVGAPILIGATLLIGAALAACGGQRAHRPSRTISPVAIAQATHEYPSRPAPRQQVIGGAISPVDAVAAFARAYINWTAETVSSDMRGLAAQSVGQARVAAQLAAGETAGDYELRRGGIANRGTVEAIAPFAAHADEYVVVTRELTSATATTAYEGLQPAWHVAIATVSRVAPGKWAVSGWQPES